MPASTIILLVFAIILGVGAPIWIIIDYIRMKKLEVAGKLVINAHLGKYNKNKTYGNLIKQEPVGKNKDLVRIHYLSKDKDENGEMVLLKQATIAHKKYIIETEDKMEILPERMDDLSPYTPYSNLYEEKILKNRDTLTLVEAEDKAYDRLSNIFIEGHRGELSRLTVKQLSDIATLLQNNNKETIEDKKEEKKD